MNYFIEKSNDDKIIIKIEENNKFKYIGSKYSVKREIDKFINSFGNIKENEIIIIFGLATGEHILELLSIIEANNKVLIIEPDKKILKVIEELENYKNLMKDKRVSILFLNDKTSINLVQVLGEYNVNPIKLAVYSNYDKLFINEFNSFINLLKGFIGETIMRIKTESTLNKIWFNCYMNNIKYMIEGIPINNLCNVFKNKTAIIVSAGPSLSENINMLKGLQNKAIIICGGRTLKSLLDVGVKPDFVCVADGGEAAFNLIKDNLNCNIPLVFYEGTNYKVVKEYAGLKFFYTNDKSVNNMLSMNVKSLGYGGSVAHTSIALAQHLGCKNIILIGQDCAFTGDKQYSKYSISNMDGEIKAEKDIFYVEDIYGNLVKTNTVLNSFRHRIEQMVELFSNVKFINCTEGGANIKGTEVIPLKEAEQKYLRENIIKNLDGYLYQRKINKVDKEAVKKKLYKIVNDYNEIKNKCDDILDYCLNIKFDNSSINSNNINIKMTGIKTYFQSIEFSRLLIVPIINENEVKEEYQCFINEEENSKFNKKIRKINSTYKTCREISDFAIELIKESIDKL